MNIEQTHIEEVLKFLLQKNIKLNFRNKTFKQGKLLLYKQNNYFLGITLQNSKRGNIKFEIPLPYNIETWNDDTRIFFDYRLIALSKRKPNLLDELKSIKGNTESRFYDSIMEIHVVDQLL